MSLSHIAIIFLRIMIVSGVNISDLGMTPSEYRSMLDRATVKIIEALRAEMHRLDIKASLNLQQSIEYRLESDNESSILMDDYWKYVNYGVSGVKRKYAGTPFSFKILRPSKRMAEAINQWRGHRGLGFDIGASFAIAANIKKRGLEPRPFIDVVDDIDFTTI